MGLIDDYNIDMDQVEESSYGKIPDAGIYEFELGDVFIQNGSKSSPDASWIIFKYLLGDEGEEYSELFGLPEDPNAPTKRELDTLGRYKGRLASLGVAPEQMNDVEADDLIGTRGVLTIVHNQGKGANKDKTYANIKYGSLEVYTGDEEPVADIPAPTTEEEVTAEAKPKRASKPKATKTGADTAVANPFARK